MNIKYQKIVRDDTGTILSGSASLLSTSYEPNRTGNRRLNHSRQTVIERLGKVIWIDPRDRNQAIFNSPTRGLVFYNLNTDVFTPIASTDARLKGTRLEAQTPRIHTNFGKSYVFFSELEKTPFMRILRNSFTDLNLYRKVLAHLAHDCLKNGSSIKCGDYLTRDCLSHVVEGVQISTLNCDSSYFFALSDDELKVKYFKTVISEMRKIHPEFGTCCYVDSTPLPGEAENNPFNALSSHGTDGLVKQSRLVLVLDIQTTIPVWFEIIPSNILDKSTIISIASDIENTLNIKIDMYDLDAGYAREELFGLFNIDSCSYVGEDNAIHDHTVLIRMPAANGYPRDDLYIQSKPSFYDPEYVFDYEHHTFFGKRFEIKLFGHREYAFVFVDKTQAESLIRGWRETHLDEWKALSASAKEWYSVKDGFFILTGNKDQEPVEALVEYRGRTKIESFFKDGKSYLQILPLASWSKETVTGKILHDIIEITIYREFRKKMAPAEMSLSRLLVCLDGWECVKISEQILEVRTPNKQVNECLEKLGYVAQGHVSLDDFRKEILEGIPMTRIPVTTRKQRNTAKVNPPVSPEEKKEAKENEKRERERKKEEDKEQRKKERAEAKAQKKKEQTKATREDTIVDENSSTHKKRGVPVGYKRGVLNKDGSPRKKPGPKPKNFATV